MQSVRESILRKVGHIGLRGAGRVIRQFAPKYSSPTAFKIPALGLDSYSGDLSDDIDWHIFYFGSYGPWELNFLADAARFLGEKSEAVNFYDIGANVGQHSLLMSARATSVFSFEPSKPTIQRFSKNVVSNNLRNVTLFNVALADEDGELELGSGFAGNTGSRSLNWSLPGKPTERVTVKHGARFFDDKSLPQMSLLKLDVEGHGKKVLTGLQARLLADRPIIMMELCGDKVKEGFTSGDDLRTTLYPNHKVMSLKPHGKAYRLVEFDWECECVIVIPDEFASSVESNEFRNAKPR